MEGPKEVNDEQRGTHAEKINQERVMASATPESNCGPDHADEKNRVQKQRLAAQKIQNGRRPALTRFRVGRHMGNRDPVMLRVPYQHRHRTYKINQ